MNGKNVKVKTSILKKIIYSTVGICILLAAALTVTSITMIQNANEEVITKVDS